MLAVDFATPVRIGTVTSPCTGHRPGLDAIVGAWHKGSGPVAVPRGVRDTLAMERYELSDGTSDKFWQIELDGDSFTVCYGRIGTKGQSKTKSFDNRAAAQAAATKVIASKVKKGYAKVGGGDESVAEAKNNLDLELAIEANPDDDDAWSVYGDWLQEEGDPRGEVIALSLAGKTDQARAAIEANDAYFLGSLVEHKQTHDGFDTDVFTWKRGFIHAIRLSHDHYAETGFEGTLAAILRDIIKHPSGRFLKEITFVFNNDPNEHDLQDLIDLLATEAPNTLRKLHFGDFDYAGPSFDTATGMTEISWYAIGDLAKLWQAVPNLRILITQGGSGESTISGTGLALGEINLPELRHAEFRTGGLAAANAQAIAKGSFPKVERLDIWYGDETYGGDATIDDVAPLLSRSDLPDLKHLGLMNALFTNDMILPLATSKLLPQLDVLDLSMGCLTDEGAKVLRENAVAFKHLGKLNLDENTMSDEALESLQAALPNIHNEEQRECEDEDYRFTAVAE